MVGSGQYLHISHTITIYTEQQYRLRGSALPSEATSLMLRGALKLATLRQIVGRSCACIHARRRTVEC